MRKFTQIFLLLLSGIVISACALWGGYQFGRVNGLSDASASGSDQNNRSEIFINGPSDDIPEEAPGIYASYCANCHGVTGEGSAIAPPLNSVELRNRLEDSEIHAVILNGRSGTAMPAWKNRLNEPKINALVSLIRNWDQLDIEEMSELEEQRPYERGMMGGCCSGMRGHHWRSP